MKHMTCISLFFPLLTNLCGSSRYEYKLWKFQRISKCIKTNNSHKRSFRRFIQVKKSQQKTMHPTAKACCFPSQKSVQMVSFSVLQSDVIPPNPHPIHTHTFCMCTHPCVCVYVYICMYAYVMGVCGQLANTLDDRSSQGFTPLAPRQENVFQFFSVNNWADSLAGAMETQTTSKS